jgi:hypothetical protein
MEKIKVFEEAAQKYDQWFDKNRYAYDGSGKNLKKESHGVAKKKSDQKNDYTQNHQSSARSCTKPNVSSHSPCMSDCYPTDRLYRLNRDGHL